MRSSKVSIDERLSRIYDYLLINNQATVNKLSEILEVSELTVRRDLAKMAETYNIERYHGGVSLKKGTLHQNAESLSTQLGGNQPYVVFSSGSYIRNMLAKKAAEFIKDEDTIFMNASTTILSIFKFINKNLRVSVITNNSMLPFTEGIENVNVILTGGQLYEHSHALVGEIATSTLSKVYASKCIMGVHGISAEAGLSTLNYQHNEINAKMISMCNGQVIIVAEGKKIGRSLSFISCGINKIDTLITDSTADTVEVKKLMAAGVDVIIVD